MAPIDSQPASAAAHRRHKQKLHQLAPSPASVLDMLSLNSPASSTASTPGLSPFSLHNTPTRRSARSRLPPANRTCSGCLPPKCRGKPTQKLPEPAGVTQPWWQAGPVPSDAASRTSHKLPGQPVSQACTQLPDLRRANSQDCPTPDFLCRFGSRSPHESGSFKSSFSNSSTAGSVNNGPIFKRGPLFPVPQEDSSHTSDNSLELRRTSGSFELRRADSKGSFELRRTDSNSSSMSGGGSKNPFALVRQRSGRSSWEFRRGLDRTSSLNEAKVLLATQLKRTESMLRPQLFHFDDHFIFEEVIGRSSTSEVFRVRHKVTGDPYAVKKSRHRFTSRADRERCLHEIQAVALLPYHPNIVGQYRAWQQGGHFYIQMDLCDGGSVSRLLAQAEEEGETGLGEAACWQVAAEVAAGLAFLHAEGVLHLDVKPSNIFANGEGGLRIGDFGLAVLKHQWDWEEGDGNYVAPELLADAEATPAADMFSLGATLYECATGQKLPRSHMAAGGGTLAEVSSALQDLIRSLLLRDPASRPSAQEVAERAREAIAAHQSEQRPATPGAFVTPPGPAMLEAAGPSPIAGLLASRRRRTPAPQPMDESMTDVTPRSDKATPFSSCTPPSPVRASRHRPTLEAESPSTPCLRPLPTRNGIDNAADTPDVCAAMCAPRGSDVAAVAPSTPPATAGPSSGWPAPLKVPSLDRWRDGSQPASPEAASPVERWPRRHFSFDPATPQSPTEQPFSWLDPRKWLKSPAAGSSPQPLGSLPAPSQGGAPCSPTVAACSPAPVRWHRIEAASPAERRDEYDWAMAVQNAPLWLDRGNSAELDIRDGSRRMRPSCLDGSLPDGDASMLTDTPVRLRRAAGRPGSVGHKRRLSRSSSDIDNRRGPPRSNPADAAAGMAEALQDRASRRDQALLLHQPSEAEEAAKMSALRELEAQVEGFGSMSL